MNKSLVDFPHGQLGVPCLGTIDLGNLVFKPQISIFNNKLFFSSSLNFDFSSQGNSWWPYYIAVLVLNSVKKFDCMVSCGYWYVPSSFEYTICLAWYDTSTLRNGNNKAHFSTLQPFSGTLSCLECFSLETHMWFVLMTCILWTFQKTS